MNDAGIAYTTSDPANLTPTDSGLYMDYDPSTGAQPFVPAEGGFATQIGEWLAQAVESLSQQAPQLILGQQSAPPTPAAPRPGGIPLSWLLLGGLALILFWPRRR